MCNPIPTFTCIVENANSKPKIDIIHHVDPGQDRSELPSVVMPTEILNDKEIGLIFKKANSEELAKMIKPGISPKLGKIKSLPISEKRMILNGVDETLRSYLPLRDTDRIATAKTKYSRRTH